MPLLIDRSGAIPDVWAQADGALPHGPVIVPLDRLGEAVARGGAIGVHIANDTDPAVLAPHLGALTLISVAFPSFSDGRGFSIARRLRAMGFVGRLRATGPVISDQFAYLLSVGFDEVAIPDDLAARQPAEQWLAAAKISRFYQRGLADRSGILDARNPS